MLNKALLARTRTELNEFTEALYAECQRQGTVIVTARNGTRFGVRFCDVNESGNAHPLFYTPDWAYCWEADGSSITAREFDLIEF